MVQLFRLRIRLLSATVAAALLLPVLSGAQQPSPPQSPAAQPQSLPVPSAPAQDRPSSS